MLTRQNWWLQTGGMAAASLLRLAAWCRSADLLLCMPMLCMPMLCMLMLQVDGSWHFRTTFLPPEQQMTEMPVRDA